MITEEELFKSLGDPLKPNQETEGNSFLGWFKDGIDSGAASTASGQMRFVQANTGIGGGIADYLDEVASANRRDKEYSALDRIPGVSDYYTNGQGFAYDAGNALGSMGVLGAETAAAAALLPSGAYAGAVGAVGKVAPKLAQAMNTPLGKLGVANVAKTVFEAPAEGGSTGAQARAEGKSEEEVRHITNEGTLKNMGFLALSNTAESLGGNLIAKGIQGVGKAAVKESAKRILGGTAAGALQNGLEERTQTAISNDLLGKPSGQIYNPGSWTPDEWDSFSVGAPVGAIVGGAGGAAASRHTSGEKATEQFASQGSAFAETKGYRDSVAGMQYDLGGDGQSGMDCGLLTQNILNRMGYEVGDRSADGQLHWAEENGTYAPNDGKYKPKPGDLVFITGTTDRWTPTDSWEQMQSNPSAYAYKGVTHVGVVDEDGNIFQAGSSGVKAVPFSAFEGKIKGFARTGSGESAGVNSTGITDATDDSAARAYLEDLVNTDSPYLDEAFAALDGQADIFETAEKLGFKPEAFEEPLSQVPIGADKATVQEQEQFTEPSSHDDFTAAHSLNDFTANEMAGVVPGRKGVVDALGALLGKRSEALAEEIADAREHTPAVRQKLVDVLNQAKNRKETQQLFARAKEKFNRSQADIKALDTDTLMRLAYNVSDKPMTNEVKQQIGRELADRGILPPAISQGVNFDKEMLDIARKRKTSTHRFTDPQTQARLNALTGEKPGEIVVPERGNTIREALAQPFTEPIQGPSGALMSAEDKVMENAYRSAVNRGEYEKAAQIAQQSGKQGIADILRNVMPEKGVRERGPAKRYGTELIANMQANNIPLRYDLREALLGDDPVAIRAAERKLHEAGIDADKIKFSFTDRHARDRERMRQQEKAAGSFVPEGYKGESTGVREGLSALEIRRLDADVKMRVQQGKTLEDIEKFYQVTYNRVKANTSSGMSEEKRIVHMQFLRGAISYVREQRRNVRQLHDADGEIDGRAVEGRNDGAVQRDNRSGDDRRGLRRTESGVTEGKSYGQTLLDLAKQSGVKADYNMLERHIEHGVKRATDFLVKKLAEQGVDIDQIKAQQAGHSEKGAFFALENKPKFSFSDRDVEEMVQRSIGQQIKVIPENIKLSPKLQRIAAFGEKLGCKVRYYDGPAQVRGFHADGVTYINRRSELPHMWVFWHESFHWLRNNNPSLYRDMLEYLKGKDGFSQKQISAYKKEIGRPELSDDAVIEEMLADYMPDAARRVGLMKGLAKDNASLAERFVAWLQDIMDRFHEFFKTPAAGLTAGQKHNAVWGFTNLARDMVDGDGKPIFKVTGIGKIGLRRNGESAKSVLRGETSVAYSAEQPTHFRISKQKLKEFVDVALRNRGKNLIFRLGRISDVLAKQVKEQTGYDVKGYVHVWKSNDVKHIQNRHGVGKETHAAQQGLDENSMIEALEAIEHPNEIKKGSPTVEGNPSIRFVKNAGEGQYTVVEVIKDNRKQLVVKTMWKKILAKHHDSNAVLLDTSETAGNTSSSIIDSSIPREANHAQDSSGEPKFSLRKDADKPVTREEIHAAINKLVTARTGKIKQKDVLGRFDARQNVVRTKFYGDFPTAAHEVGHYIDDQLQIKGHTLELVQYARKRFPNGQYKASELRAEGIAEFGRLILTKPTLAEKEFPGYFKAYQKAIEEHPELGKPLDEIGRKMRQWYAQSPEARGSGSVVSAKDKGFKERVKEALDDLYVNWVDKLDPLRKMNAEIERVLEKKMGYQENIYERARMAESFARGRAQMLVTEENPKLAIDALNKAAKTKLRHKVTLRSIFDSIAEEKMNKLYPDYLKRGNFENWHKAFSVYLVARRQMELQRQLPKYNGPLSREDAAAIYKNAPRELAEAAYDYYRYNDNLLTIAEDAGLISKDLHAVLNEKYANYAPMLRDFSDEEAVDSFFGGMGGKGIGNVSNFLKKISEDGSDRNVLDPLEVTVKNTFVVLDRAERNKVAQLFVDLSKENALGKFAEELPGVKASDPKRSIFTVMVNGEKKAYQTLPEFYGAIAGSNQLSANVVANLFRSTAQMLRTGATISPDFILRNLFRDTIFAGISSKTGFIPIVDTIRGMRALKQNAELAAEFRAAGVPMSNFVGTNRRGASQTLDEMAGTASWRKLTPLKVLHSLYEYAQDASELVESSSRMGEFMRARQQGKSIEEAGYLAKELTLDFGRSGIWGQKANQAIPFFNACIQGGDKMYRLLRDQPKPTLFALAKYIMLPSVLLWALNHDEDWYKELPEDVKNGSWVWKAGDTIYRLPKPQEAGVLFGSSLERLLDQINGENPKAVKEWSKYMKETVLPSATPALITPIFEWMTNYSFFREKPIVGRREENLPDALQYNAYTSELAKRLGGALNLSPMKIDNTIRGYFGTAGAFVAQSMDRFFGKEHEMPEKRWSELAGIRGFTHTEYGRAKSVEEFYRIHDAIMKEHNAHGVKGHPAGYVQGARLAAKQISAAQKDIRSITVNPKLSPVEKRRQIDLRQKRILDVAKRANKALEKYVTE